MSDMYLILRHRLEDVAQDWIAIDGQVLVDARKERGLSREAIGPLVGVVAKTWERYEKENRLPRALVPRVAQVLGLEIETPVHAVRSLAVEPHQEELEAVVAQGFADLRVTLELLRADVAELSRRIPPATKPRRSRGRAV